MNGGKITASAPVSSSPALAASVNGSFALLAGGLMRGNWLHVKASTVNIEASGVMSTANQGHGPRTGPGQSSGKLHGYPDI